VLARTSAVAGRYAHPVNPHPDLDIGLDVLWNHLNTAYKGNGVSIGPSGARPGGVYFLDDQEVLSVMFRIQRNFLPWIA